MLKNICATRGHGEQPHEPLEPADVRDVNMPENVKRSMGHAREEGFGMCKHCGSLFFALSNMADIDYIQQDGCPNDD